MRNDTKAILCIIAAIIDFFLLCFFKASHPDISTKQFISQTWWAWLIMAILIFASLEFFSKNDIKY